MGEFIGGFILGGMITVMICGGFIEQCGYNRHRKECLCYPADVSGTYKSNDVTYVVCDNKQVKQFVEE
jgi:hypothetical protein